jgi:hypothetical protein
MTRPHRCMRHGKSRPVGAGASPWRVGALRRARPLAWACALALRRAAQTGQSVVSTGCCVDATRGVGADTTAAVFVTVLKRASRMRRRSSWRFMSAVPL